MLRVVKRVVQTLGPHRADSDHVLPIVGRCCEHGAHAAEPIQQRSCRSRRNAWNGRQHRLRGFGLTPALWALGVNRPISPAARSADRKTEEPLCRIESILALNDADSLVKNREQRAAECIGVHGARLRNAPFEKQVAPRVRRSERAQLSPKSAAQQCSLEIPYGFPLDRVATIDDVIAGLERLNSNVRADVHQHSGDTAPLFVDVDKDRRARRHNASRLPPKLCLVFSQREKT